jgi:ADP-ribose pyrophosphatase
VTKRRPASAGLVAPDFREAPVRRNRVYRGRAVHFMADTVRLPTGVLAVREYMDHPGAVAVVPVLNGGSSNPTLLLVQQYRYPVRELTMELPAGKLSRGENPAACVRRELEEETGFRPGRIQKLVSYWPTPAFANEIIHIFVARNLRPGRFHPDEDELIRPVKMTLRDALRRIQRGLIKDSKTLVGLLAFAQTRS